MTPWHVFVLSTALALLLLGLLAGLVKQRLWVSEPALLIALGALLGPHACDLLRISDLGPPHTLLEQLARLTMAIAVSSAALRLPRGFLRRSRGVWLMLSAGMLAMWALSTAGVSLVLDWGFWTAALIGAIITPTDPVLAGAIVTGRLAEERLPGRLRHLLSAESGANDGLAFPLVLLPLLIFEHGPAAAWSRWFVETWWWDVVVAVLSGLVIGFLAGRLLRIFRRVGALGQSSGPTLTAAAALVAIAAVKLMGSDGILAAFSAATVLRREFDEEDLDRNIAFHESLRRFFEFPLFILFGLALPIDGWRAFGWPLLGLTIVVLLLRRPPAFLLLARAAPETPQPAGRWFAAWFGPIGVAALYYAMLALRHGRPETVWHVVSAVIVASALAHGISATPATRRFPNRPA